MPVLTPPSSSGDAYALAEDATPLPVAPDAATLGGPQAQPIAKAAEQASPAQSAIPAQPAPVPAAEPTAAAKGAEPPKAAPAPAVPKKRRRKRRYTEIPGWGISLVIHGAILLALLGISTQLTEKPKKIDLNSALTTEVGEEEPLKILADPVSDQRSETLSNPNLVAVASATPNVSSATKVDQRSSMMPDIQAPGLSSPLATMPAAPAVDLGNRGMISGDVTAAVDTIDQALDQLAREILRNLNDHKLLVVWMFDESNSMKDDQQAVKSKFDRVSSELRSHVNKGQKENKELLHAVVGFGGGIHFEQEPTEDEQSITRAIDRLRTDQTGAENTLQAFARILAKYNSYITKDRRLMTVLVTDESGDDGQVIEETRDLARKHLVPVYVVGRQSLLGADQLHIQYQDPVTKDIYHPTIKRGPETADFELLQYDGIHGRWDETPSGFAPYELARLTKETGGMYFILPNEEQLRVNNRRLERAYSIATLREYVPDYESRAEYVLKRNKSDLRRSMYQIIQASKKWGFDHHLPTDYVQYVTKAKEVMGQCAIRQKQLEEAEKVLKALEPLRERETEKRWQAAYDLMRAQIVVYQIKAVEFMFALKGVGDTKPALKNKPNKDQQVIFDFGHGKQRWVPAEKSDKMYAEGERLLKLVMERHPKTPWADLAKDELDKGFGVIYWEWVRDRRYAERAKLVPKY